MRAAQLDKNRLQAAAAHAAAALRRAQQMEAKT
jgi:hypothetical protein